MSYEHTGGNTKGSAAGRTAGSASEHTGGHAPLLVLDEVNVELTGRRILTGVNLRVEEAQLIGLVGPNGAGKTTLMRAIMGLIPTSAGKLERTGLPGYVPQRHDIEWGYPISVEQTVMTSLQMRKRLWERTSAADWKRVYEALDMVAMKHLRRRTLDELSGGQKQRVLIARALARSPRLLLLDEPFTGLDHPTQDELTALLRELTERGVAILMSTHDLSQAIDVCDSLVLLKGGIIAQGRTGELTDPQLWMDAFEVGPSSALLRTVGVAAPSINEDGARDDARASEEASARDEVRACDDGRTLEEAQESRETRQLHDKRERGVEGPYELATGPLLAPGSANDLRAKSA